MTCEQVQRLVATDPFEQDHNTVHAVWLHLRNCQECMDEVSRKADQYRPLSPQEMAECQRFAKKLYEQRILESN